jgi:hypothetical protein
MMNFLEKKTVDEANEVDLSVYTFMERLSSQRGYYCFKIREMKRKS